MTDLEWRNIVAHIDKPPPAVLLGEWKDSEYCADWVNTSSWHLFRLAEEVKRLRATSEVGEHE